MLLNTWCVLHRKPYEVNKMKIVYFNNYVVITQLHFQGPLYQSMEVPNNLWLILCTKQHQAWVFRSLGESQPFRCATLKVFKNSKKMNILSNSFCIRSKKVIIFLVVAFSMFIIPIISYQGNNNIARNRVGKKE